MSIIANNLLQGDEGYNISRSLRFRSSASAYLNRTPASSSNRQTWTWSGWVKLGLLNPSSGWNCIFGAYSDDNNRTFFYTNNNSVSNTFYIFDVNGGSTTCNLISTQVLRDSSAWYHLIVAVDTTQSTSSNRIKVYLNGSQITSFGTASYPSQNANFMVNNNVAHYVGASNYSGLSLFHDGYMAEINFIDGQALTPSSFGETDPITGVWKAKKYGGTYGTNGFYLDFKDNSSTAALGYDAAGSNDWTVNNISLTAGTTYDSMVDVPTLTSATTANYCVMNPLFNNQIGINSANTGTVTITNGNLTIAPTSSSIAGAVGTLGVSSGKWYFEYTITTASVSGDVAGFITSFSGAVTSWIGYRTNGSIYSNGTTTSGYATATAGDIIGIALDIGGSTVSCYKNNTLLATITLTNAITADCFPLIWFRNDTGSGSVNFGQQPFSYTPPTGFVALNTFNLPEPSIKAGNKYMDAVLYTGTTGSNLTVSSVGFQPDFVWLKARNQAGYGHQLYDAVRGVQLRLRSNTTDAEGTNTGGLLSFNSNGYTVGTDGFINETGTTMASWVWKAGNSAGSSNTAGSITSTVSANPTAGFSIVTYTGTGSNATVGHGLGVAPNWVIVKQRNASADWVMRSNQLAGNDYTMILDNTSAQTSYSPSVWNNTAPTSSVFSIGTNSAINTNGNTYVAYCFAEVAGYSKALSWTGNGSTDGVFVNCGFSPAFIIMKRTDSTSDWVVIDNKRLGYNATDVALNPNASYAENSGYATDFTSNGFKLRTTTGYMNASGGTYIGFAFAQNPFKYSLAR